MNIDEIRKYLVFASIRLVFVEMIEISGVLTELNIFDMNNAEGGLLRTIVIYVVFMPICGYLGDRYNRKWIMIIGIFIWLGTVLAFIVMPAHVIPFVFSVPVFADNLK